MTETPNLHLTKDDPEEYYSVERVNANSDRIDEFAGSTASALASKQDTLTFDTTPTPSSERPVTSGGLYVAIEARVAKTAYQTDKAAIEAEIVAAEKAGAKNFCPYNTLTASSAGTIINDQPISLPAGTYILTFKHTATAGSTAFRFSYNGTSVQSFTVNNTDTGSKSREFTLDSEVNQFRVYTAVANTYTEMMIRQAGASAGYQPYAPTNRELYEMILALQAGS